MQPDPDCQLCPRLAAHRAEMRAREPGWFNAPVPAIGDETGWLAIIGLAPGARGANRTGRPFTGDASGEMLFATLQEAGLASHDTADEAPQLNGTLIVNAVRCLPPANKPDPTEIRQCRPFLADQLKAMPNLTVVLALGQVAHQSAVKALGGKLPKHRFAHAAVHRLHTGYTLVDSYHCSRLNQNTGRLTHAMFRAAIDAAIAAHAQTAHPQTGGR